MSNVFEAVLSSPEALLAFGDKSFVQAMLRFEAALARAQASCGLIPAAYAQSIIGTCKVELFDTAKIVRESPGAGGLAISLVKSLKETVGLFNPDAVAHVHFGATSQDAIDTAMALMTRDVLHWIERDVRQSIDALLALAARHADTPMLARTLMRPSSIASFGFKCLAWGAPLVRGLKRLRAAAPGALALQLGAAVGPPAPMNGQGARVSELMALDLGLTLAPMPWHTQRDEWVALGCELGLLAGSLGKIAKDIVLLSQFEVGEVMEVVEVGSSVRSVQGERLKIRQRWHSLAGVRHPPCRGMRHSGTSRWPAGWPLLQRYGRRNAWPPCLPPSRKRMSQPPVPGKPSWPNGRNW